MITGLLIKKNVTYVNLLFKCICTRIYKKTKYYIFTTKYLIIIIYILFSSIEVYENGITYYNVIIQLKIFLNNYLMGKLFDNYYL